MARFENIPGVARVSRKATALLASSALGCTLGIGLGLGLPGVALADNECGAPVAGVVTCTTGSPTGANYTTTTGMTINAANGAAFGNPGVAGKGGLSVTQAGGGSGDLIINAAGATTTTTTSGSPGVRAGNSGAGNVVVHTGAVSVTGSGATAVRAGTNNGNILVDVTGDVTSTSGFGISAGATNGGLITINVAAGKTVSGGVTGIDAAGPGGAVITNRGTIKNTVPDTNPDDAVDGGAINIAYDFVPAGTTINNYGVITAANPANTFNGVAIGFDSGDDTLNLFTGSQITGIIDGGAGLNTVNLVGSSATKVDTQTFGRLHDFSALNVNSGYWTLDTEAYVDHLNIASGATLEVVQNSPTAPSNDSGLGGATGAIAIVDNGRLLITEVALDPTLTSLNSKDGKIRTYGDGSQFSVSGSGVLDLQGQAADPVLIGGTVSVGGGLNVLGGRTVVTGTVSSPTTVASGANLTIGSGVTHDTISVDADGDHAFYTLSGAGTSGTVSGSLTDNGVVDFIRSDAVTFAGLTGSGAVNQIGGGALTLNNYGLTGVATLKSGSLAINGAANANINGAINGTIATASKNAVALTAIGTGTATLNVAAGSSATSAVYAAFANGAGGATVTNAGTLGGINAVSSNGAVTVNGGTSAVTVTGISAIRALGSTGVTVTGGTSTSTGGNFNSTTKTADFNGDVRADAIFAASANGAALVNTGVASATGLGARGVTAITSTGNVTVNVTGNVSSTQAEGAFLFADKGGTANLNVAAGTTLSGASVGAQLTSTTQAAVVNSGTIQGSARGLVIGDNNNVVDPLAATVTNEVGGVIKGVDGALRIGSEGGLVRVINRGTIQSTGTTPNSNSTSALDIGGLTHGLGAIVDNYGTIIGGLAGKKDGDGNPLIGTAIGFDGDDDSDLADTLNLYTGSNIVGSVAMFGGLDTVNLNGTVNTKTATQRFGGIFGSEVLNVKTGYWILNAESNADAVNISSGATLEMFENTAAGPGGFITPLSGALAVVNNGTLAANSDDNHFYSDADHLSLTGTGVTNLQAGSRVVGSNWVQSAVNAQAGTTLITGAVTGNLNISKGATVELGAALSAPNSDGAVTITGAGTTGAVNGNIVDDGTFIYNRSNNYTFNGGFGGSGSLVMRGGGTLTLNGLYTYTGGTTVESGLLKITQLSSSGGLNTGTGSTVDLSGGNQTVGALNGSGGTVNIDKGSLTVANAPGDSSTFAGNLTGAGALTLSGGGTLNLTGTNTYTGPTTVTGGSTVKVNGSITSNVTASGGGAVAGSGTITGNVNIGSGGVYSPGNSPGVSHVVGNVTFATGSTYKYEIDPSATPTSDLIAITGGQAIVNGGTLAVTAAGTSSSYVRRNTYTAVTADGGVTGTGFTNATSSASFLTPYLSYGAKDVSVVLVNNSISLATVGASANQVAVLSAVNTAAPGSNLYDAVAPMTDDNVRLAADQLSGESFGGTSTALVERSGFVRRALQDRMAQTSEGTNGWAMALSGQTRGKSAGAAEIEADTYGALVGVDTGEGAWRLGGSLGYTQGDIDAKARAASTSSKGVVVGAYASGDLGPVKARLGASWTRQSLKSDRLVTAPGLLARLSGSYDANITDVFGRLELKALDLGGAKLTPFGELGATRVKTDRFTETGGAAALTVAGEGRTVTYGSLGLRLAGETAFGDGGTLAPYLSLAYRGASGDTDSLSRNRFGAGPAFTTQGTSLDSGGDVTVGADIYSARMRIGVSYEGQFGGDWKSDAFKLNGAWRF